MTCNRSVTDGIASQDLEFRYTTVASLRRERGCPALIPIEASRRPAVPVA